MFKFSSAWIDGLFADSGHDDEVRLVVCLSHGELRSKRDALK